MAKAVKTKLSWTKSPSEDVVSQTLTFTTSTGTTVTDLPAGVESWEVQIDAMQDCTFKIDTKDAEGNVTSSEVYTFHTGDLIAPLPATNLSHEFLEVVDVPDPTPPPVMNRR